MSDSSDIVVVALDGSTVCTIGQGVVGTGAELKRYIEKAAGIDFLLQRLLVGPKELEDDAEVPDAPGILVTLMRVEPLVVATACDDSKIRIFDPLSGDLLHEFFIRGASRAALSPDRTLVAIAAKTKVAILDLSTGAPMEWPEWDGKGRPTAELSFKKGADCVAFSRDGKLLIIASHDNKARIVNLATGAVLYEIAHHTSLSRVFCAVFNADASLAATGMEDGMARVIDVATGKIVREVKHPSHVLSVSFGTGGLLATGDGRGFIRIIDVASNEIKQTVNIEGFCASSVCFNSDASRLATGNHLPQAAILDAASGEKIWACEHPRSVFSVCFSRDDRILATADQGGVVRIFDVVSGEILREITHPQAVRSVSFPGV